MLPFAVVNGSQIAKGPLANACPTVSSRLPFLCNGTFPSATEWHFLPPPLERTRSDHLSDSNVVLAPVLPRPICSSYRPNSILLLNTRIASSTPRTFPFRAQKFRSILFFATATPKEIFFTLGKSRSKFNGVDRALRFTNQTLVLEILHQISISCTKQPRMAH